MSARISNIFALTAANIHLAPHYAEVLQTAWIGVQELGRYARRWFSPAPASRPRAASRRSATAAADCCDVFVVVGTSGLVLGGTRGLTPPRSPRK
jgi:hypothetical protein